MRFTIAMATIAIEQPTVTRSIWRPGSARQAKRRGEGTPAGQMKLVPIASGIRSGQFG